MVTPYYADDNVVIYHGDCREILEWNAADVMVTDPPYGIDFASNMGGKFRRDHVWGDRSVRARDDAVQIWNNPRYALSPERSALIFGSWKQPRPNGTRHVLYWEKGDHVGMGDLSLPWRPNVEEIYVLGDGFEGHRGSSVLRINALSPNFTPPAQRFHPTEKPLALMILLLQKTTGYIVADPFMGSGTTIKAAKELGRQAIGIEIEERYCEIAAKRCAQEVLAFAESPSGAPLEEQK